MSNFQVFCVSVAVIMTWAVLVGAQGDRAFSLFVTLIFIIYDPIFINFGPLQKCQTIVRKELTFSQTGVRIS